MHHHRLVATHVVLGWVALFTFAQSADACSEPEQPPGYADFGEVYPRDGSSDVASNTAIFVKMNYVKAGSTAPPVLTLTHVDTGESVVGDVAQQHWGDPISAFRPLQPLEPDTAYRLQGHVATGASRPARADGAERLDVTFTTGHTLLAALEIVGKLRVELEDYERPDYSTCDGGECECNPTETVLDTRAIVTLPGGRGGLAEYGYLARVDVTGEPPFDIGQGDSPHVYSNAAEMIGSDAGVVLEVPQLRHYEEAYQPCVTLELRDLAGNTVSSEAKCLKDEVAPLARVDGAEAEITSDELKGDADNGNAAAENDASSGGCSVMARRRTGSSGVAFTALTLALFLIGTRRRGGWLGSHCSNVEQSDHSAAQRKP